MPSLVQPIAQALADSRAALDAFLADTTNLRNLERLSAHIAAAFRRRNLVLACGNGGSQCDALHFAEEFSGRFRKDRPALPALALGEACHLSCVGNDFGFEEVYRRQVEALGRKGGLLIAISTSGNSENIIRAVREARKRGLRTAAFLGKGGGKMKGLCDVEFIVEARTSDRVQEVHMAALHVLIEAVERRLYPEHYAP